MIIWRYKAVADVILADCTVILGNRASEMLLAEVSPQYAIHSGAACLVSLQEHQSSVHLKIR